MPVYHVTLSFCTNEHGWVEQFYRRDVSFQSALAAGVDLANRRRTILGAGVSLYRVRVTQPGLPRAVASQEVSGPTLSTPIASAFEGAEIRLGAGVGGRHRRNYLLRGLPRDAIVNPRGPARWAPYLQAAGNAWLASLADGKWSERCRGYEGDQLPILDLVAILNPGSDPFAEDGGPPGPGTYTTAAMATVDGPLVVPDPDPETGEPVMVRISRARWDDPAAVAETPINGEFPVLGPTLGALQYFGSCPFVGSYAGSGTLQVTRAAYLPIVGSKLVRSGVRKCGPVQPSARLPGQLPGNGQLVVSSFSGPGVPGLTPLQEAARLSSQITPRTTTPPVIPAPADPPFPDPISGNLSNLQKVLTYILGNMGFSGTGANYTPIGIAPIMNMVKTWWIGLTGFYPTEYSDTGVLAAVSAGLGRLNNYANTVRRVIEQNIPDDAQLIFQGHSLGGMTCENLLQVDDIRERTVTTTTFGSPVTSVSFRPRSLLRFRVSNDYVPVMSPLGLASELTFSNNYFVIPADPAIGGFPRCHTRMDLFTDLTTYDNWGLTGGGNPPFILGPLQRFRVPG